MQTTTYHQHWQQLKSQLPPATLVFIRLGDFYETFESDAKSAAPLLNVALTKRNSIPMCGFPVHAQQSYLDRLAQAGKTVALTARPSPTEPFATERVLCPPTGTHNNPIRYASLDPTAPDYRQRFTAQLDQAMADANSGKCICLSDLIGNAGM